MGNADAPQALQANKKSPNLMNECPKAIRTKAISHLPQNVETLEIASQLLFQNSNESEGTKISWFFSCFFRYFANLIKF